MNDSDRNGKESKSALGLLFVILMLFVTFYKMKAYFKKGFYVVYRLYSRKRNNFKYFKGK